MNKILCNPILSLKILIYLRFKSPISNYIIYYEIFPIYIRALIKILKISEDKISYFISKIFNIKLIKILHGDKIDCYNNIRINVLIKIANISEEYIPNIIYDPWFSFLKKIIHSSVAIPTSAKLLCLHQLRINLLCAKLSMIANNESYNTNTNLIMYNNYYWPDKLLSIIKRDDYFKDISFMEVPLFIRIINKVSTIIKLHIISFKYFYIYGVNFGIIKKKKYDIAAEIFDLNMLGRKKNDTDFFIDNVNFTNSNSIFYITSRQNKFIEKNGINSQEIRRLAKNLKINIIQLRNLGLTIKYIFKILYWQTIFTFYCFKKQCSSIFDLFPKIFEEHITYLPLFIHYDIKNHIHFMTPNGNARLCLNSGIITGLCRQNNVRSNGIQNRIIDARHYEFCFFCYDIYFAWGQAWIDTLGTSLDFVIKKKIVGTFNIVENDIIRAKNNIINDTNILSNMNIILFPTDIDINPTINSGSHYTFSYFINFLDSCLMLAKKYPKINFYCKLKDKEHFAKIMKYDQIKKLNIQMYNNFHFLMKERMDYIDTLIDSYISISIGYTSPGFDALILNINSIYYSDLINAGNALKVVPNLVVENRDDLISVFDKLVKNRSTYNYTNLDLLDPYRDGKSIKRIINNLSSL